MTRKREVGNFSAKTARATASTMNPSPHSQVTTHIMRLKRGRAQSRSGRERPAVSAEKIRAT